MSKPIEVYEGQVGAFDRGSFLVVNDIVTDPLHDHYGKRVRVTVEALEADSQKPNPLGPVKIQVVEDYEWGIGPWVVGVRVGDRRLGSTCPRGDLAQLAMTAVTLYKKLTEESDV